MSDETRSVDTARRAIRLAITSSRTEEEALKRQFRDEGVVSVAIDYGGDFASSVRTVIERAVVAAKREGVIEGTYAGEGAVAGATREALAQLTSKALGLNTGGKIGVVRQGSNVAVAIFCGIGLLHLNEAGIGLGHRAIAK